MATANLIIERLREQIQKVEAAPRRSLVTLTTGLEEVDALSLLRLGCVVELCGEEASGRTSVALRAVAAAGREKRLSAWVDGPQELYPPAAPSLGVELERLLIVRPKAPSQLVWAAVQVLRSGAFTCVVLDVTHTGVQLTMTDTKKLLDAARVGGALLLLVTSQAAPAPGVVRLMLRSFGAPPLERHLKLVVPTQGSDEEAWFHEVDVVHRGGTRRRAVVSRQLLCGHRGARPRRATRVVWGGLQVSAVAPLVIFKRLKQHDLREYSGR